MGTVSLIHSSFGNSRLIIRPPTAHTNENITAKIIKHKENIKSHWRLTSAISDDTIRGIAVITICIIIFPKNISLISQGKDWSKAIFFPSRDTETEVRLLVAATTHSAMHTINGNISSEIPVRLNIDRISYFFTVISTATSSTIIEPKEQLRIYTGVFLKNRSSFFSKERAALDFFASLSLYLIFLTPFCDVENFIKVRERTRYITENKTAIIAKKTRKYRIFPDTPFPNA